MAETQQKDFFIEAIEKGYSPFMLKDDTESLSKDPEGKWKIRQTEAPSIKDFTKEYNKTYTKQVGFATGFNDLEVIDVDTKVFKDAQERSLWTTEFLDFLDSNISDFNNKFVIYLTQSDGLHILFRSNKLEGNQKLAKLEGHTAQILETRGTGGYVKAYVGKQYTSDRTYLDVDYISDEDREILFSCCRSFNHIDEVSEVPKKPSKSITLHTDGLTPWDDYNAKTDALDLLREAGFKILRGNAKQTPFVRQGADSSHSGYVFTDTGMAYFHSTGTQFENNLGYMPYHLYRDLYHNGNGSEASKELYAKGFGDRYVKPLPELQDEVEDVDVVTDFPVNVFPLEFQKYIALNNSTLNHSIDYMSCSLLFLTSIIIGNSMIVERKKGWDEPAVLWMSLVGKAGVGKTPSIKSIMRPLNKLNNKAIKQHIKDKENYSSYVNMDKAEQELMGEVKPASSGQFIINDATLEALVDLHQQNANGVGVLKDELAGFFKDMNKYREGGDLEHWLSSWSGESINLNRKSAKSGFVEKAFLPIMGGIQPSVLSGIYTEANSGNGFIDRILFSYPDLDVDVTSDDEMSQDILDWYDSAVGVFHSSVKRNIKYTEDGSIEPIVVQLSPEAKAYCKSIEKSIVDMINGDVIPESMTGMLSKQKSYVLRFALNINTLTSFMDSSIDKSIITLDSMKKAEELFKYFLEQELKVIKKEKRVKRISFKVNHKKSDFENYKNMLIQTPNIKRAEASRILDVGIQKIDGFRRDIKKEQASED